MITGRWEGEAGRERVETPRGSPLARDSEIDDERVVAVRDELRSKPRGGAQVRNFERPTPGSSMSFSRQNSGPRITKALGSGTSPSRAQRYATHLRPRTFVLRGAGAHEVPTPNPAWGRCPKPEGSAACC